MQQLGAGKALQTALIRLRRDIKNYRFAAAALLIYAAAATLLFGTICPLAALTGFPCPGCGSTRALFFVLTGRLGAAFRYSPCIYLWILLAAYVGWQRYVRGRRAAGALAMAGGISAVMILVYLYRMAVDFPGSPPMNYRENNVLAGIFPFYDELMRRLLSL
ncbi:MAG TPA: DUF2752 domain-containing protein [Candidatus Eisenbergiella merdipullorum]|uniref:DUF2752 domain-containing protein n=1 Tax=Candidatus Eisenbergiella merdipullorum TaxID=2838553 RepID=A0A9D2L288_9FIRM|nr:DUF2752 domain-containing protein [Candidatus Eisenbergiella merdipullorum]